MTRSSLKYAGFAAAIIAIGLAVGWYAAGPSVKPITSAVAEENLPGRVFANHSSTNSAASHDDATNADGTPVSSVVVHIAPEPVEPLSWSDNVGNILGDSETSIPQKNELLFAAYTNAPPEGQAEIVSHLCNLIEPEQYDRLGKILLDAKTPAAVSEELLNDLGNRPNSKRATILLAIARNPQHPQAAAAREQLAQLLEEDYGKDWHQWELKSDAWLKDNPD
ncbi:MAG: hypothetical protein RLZZ350_1099 [Verrucomicrobiota bacterium]|jgi:hypothetical protein